MLTLNRCSAASDKCTVVFNFSSSKTLFSISKLSNNILMFTISLKGKTAGSSLGNKYEPKTSQNILGILRHSTDIFTNRRCEKTTDGLIHIE